MLSSGFLNLRSLYETNCIAGITRPQSIDLRGSEVGLQRLTWLLPFLHSIFRTIRFTN
jgi:hypothetical protein